MEDLGKWMQTFIKGIPIKFVPADEPYGRRWPGPGVPRAATRADSRYRLDVDACSG